MAVLASNLPCTLVLTDEDGLNGEMFRISWEFSDEGGSPGFDFTFEDHEGEEVQVLVYRDAEDGYKLKAVVQ